MIAELSDIMTSVDGDLPDASQSATEAGAIVDWRFNRRVGTRAEAMRKLVQAGIDLPMLCIDLLEPLKHDGSIDRSPDVASAANAWKATLAPNAPRPVRHRTEFQRKSGRPGHLPAMMCRHFLNENST